MGIGLYMQGDDRIFAIPSYSNTLKHIMPAKKVQRHQCLRWSVLLAICVVAVFDLRFWGFCIRSVSRSIKTPELLFKNGYTCNHGRLTRCHRSAASDDEASTSPSTRGDGSSAREPSDAEMLQLQQLIEEARRAPPTIPVIVLDAMLPRQRLQLKSSDSTLETLSERGEFAIFGAHANQVLQHGVSAELNKIDRDTWEIRGKHPVKLVGQGKRDDDGLMVAQVETVSLDAATDLDVEVAKLLIPLVKEWLNLVQGSSFERFEGQISGILEDLGPAPSPKDAGELALWVAALVNPLPALGVAREIRPLALSAATISARLQVVLDGIRGSIGHVSGKAPLF